MSLDISDLETDFVDELKPGTELMRGQYKIDTFIAAGGFGLTYLAKDSLDRAVVIKECFPGNFCRRQNHSVLPRSRAHQAELRSIVRLFSQEAMNLAKAKHPNIVGVHQVFEENGTAYMALDYVQGRDLLDILEENPESLTPDVVESYLVQLLGAIKHIHELGILHRDISPDNIIVNADGEPILIDFGAARQNSPEKASRMLSALRVVKDGYSPQEFYIAGGDQSESCDLYSLAASFYHIITGDLPPDSQIRLSARATEQTDPYVPLTGSTSDYSTPFCEALDKAMAILPKERMKSADAWLGHLSGTAPVDMTPVVETKAPHSPSKDARLVTLLGASAMAAAVGLGVYVSTGGSKEAPVAATSSRATLAALGPAPSIASFTPNVLTEFSAPAAIAVQRRAAETDTPPVVVASTAADALAETSTRALTPIATAETEDLPTALATAAAEDGPGLAPPEKPALAEIENLVTVIPQPLAPDADEASPSVLATIFGFAPRNEAVGENTLSVALLNDEEAQPLVDFSTPALPVEPKVEEEIVAVETAEAPSTAATPSEAETETETGVAFFMAMDKEQPELVYQKDTQQAAAEPLEPATAALPEPVSDEPELASEEDTWVVTRSVPMLPFTLADWDPGLIASVDDTGPSWLTRNSRIVTINGDFVASTEDIRAKFEELASTGDSTTFDVSLGIETAEVGNYEQTLTVAKERHILLLNGLRFVARDSGSGWTTEVLEAPGTSNFQAGDRLLSYISTWEDLDSPESLQSILERELAAGESSFGFSVSRGDEVWIETFVLSTL